jgi:hypothetical protein
MTYQELQALIAPLSEEDRRRLRELLDGDLQAVEQAGDLQNVPIDSVKDHKRYPLQGSVLRYEAPTEPVALEDWDAVK